MNCSPVKNRIVIIPHRWSCLGRGEDSKDGAEQGMIDSLSSFSKEEIY